MGTAESKFKDAVRTGDHQKAYELFFNKKILRDNLNPGDACYNDGSSVLHQAARHGMQPLYEEFLGKKSVNPLKQNFSDQNCLHLICSSGIDGDVRKRMLESTLQHDYTVSKGSHAVVSATDKEGNTPLHLACESGLFSCVELLLNANSDLKIKNDNGKTPVDLASEAGYEELAKHLETRLVFDPTQSDEHLPATINPSTTTQSAETHIHMKDQQIQSMKDSLLIETSELLGVSLFTAEALLRNHGWSKQGLLDAWMADPAGTCDKAGVEMPPILSVDNIDDSLMAAQIGCGLEGEECECGICCCPVEERVVVPCGHAFCRDCWTQYLNDKITAGNVHDILCPQYACYRLVPIHVVEKLVSREMAHKYLRYDIKAFVDSNPNIRWCPHPGCGQAVQRESEGLEATPNQRTEPPSSLAVRCGNNHYFCWGCGETVHQPCSCELWSDWLKKCTELLARIGNMTADEVSEAATAQWVSSNSKPCPNCRANIEKNDGCNHMRCTKCKHDFCWMCLDPWSKHSSATGGYFECNRYKEITKADDLLRERRNESDRYEKLSYFQHFYSRYSNHQDSLKHEMKYLESADEKMEQLRMAAINAGTEAGNVLFVEEAMRTLVEARQTLVASYAYGYFIVYTAKRKTFENLQGDFEENVETLADVVAKPYLRRPRIEIIRLTSLVREKQIKFVHDIEIDSKAPSPPPRPPSLSQNQRLSSAAEYLRQRREQVERDRERREQERRAREEREREEREREEREMDNAIKASQQEFDCDSQLKSDTELAIFLSMQDGSEQLNNLDDPSNGNAGGMTLTPEDTISFPHHSDSQNSNSDPVFNPATFDLEKWRRTLIEWSGSNSSSTTPSPPDSHASSPISTLPLHIANEYGPLYGEEEDLATAIALSLSAVTDEAPKNNLSRGGQVGQELPNPLRNAMVTVTRPAANV